MCYIHNTTPCAKEAIARRNTGKYRVVLCSSRESDIKRHQSHEKHGTHTHRHAQSGNKYTVFRALKVKEKKGAQLRTISVCVYIK